MMYQGKIEDDKYLILLSNLEFFMLVPYSVREYKLDIMNGSTCQDISIQTQFYNLFLKF